MTESHSNATALRRRALVVAAACSIGVLAPVGALAQYPIKPGPVPGPGVPPETQSVVTTAAPAQAPSQASATTASPVTAPTVSVAPAVRVLGEQTTLDPIAFTGSNAVRPLVGAGLTAIAAGALFVVVTRRRRPAGHPTG